MVEGGISELFKWWLYLILLFGAMALFLFIFQVGQTNRFSSYVAAEIERGGVQIVGFTSDDHSTAQTLSFTPEAESRIRQENDSNYGGRYTVSLDTSVDMDTNLTYGDLIDYSITGMYTVMFDWFKAPILNTNDQAIIQVRLAGSDGSREFVKSMFEYDDFVYKDVDGAGILVGFSDIGKAKYTQLKADGGYIGHFIVPDRNPASNVTITHIADYAFAVYDFEGDFIGPNVKVIGKGAFRDSSSMTGEFKAPNVMKIDDGAFTHAQFVGALNADELSVVGNSAFEHSHFNSMFNATRVDQIGANAFKNSTFKGSFNAPIATVIGQNAFMNSTFDGYYNARMVKTLGKDAFKNSQFKNK